MNKLSNRLIKLKKDKNLLQKDIAKDVNLSLRAYQYYERGQREPTASVLIALADYLTYPLTTWLDVLTIPNYINRLYFIYFYLRNTSLICPIF